MAFTVQEMISGNNGIAVYNGAIFRIPVLGEWTRLRLGIFGQVPINAAHPALLGTPRMVMGFCNAAGGPPLAANCQHFLGVATGATSLLYNSNNTGTGSATVGQSNTARRWHVTNGSTQEQVWAAGTGASNWYTGAIRSQMDALPKRAPSFMEIVKTGENELTAWFLRRVANGGTFDNSWQCQEATDDEVFALMESDAPLSSFGGYWGGTNGFTVHSGGAVDVTGLPELDAVAFGWSRSQIPWLVGPVWVSSD